MKKLLLVVSLLFFVCGSSKSDEHVIYEVSGTSWDFEYMKGPYFGKKFWVHFLNNGRCSYKDEIEALIIKNCYWEQNDNELFFRLEEEEVDAEYYLNFGPQYSHRKDYKLSLLGDFYFNGNEGRVYGESRKHFSFQKENNESHSEDDSTIVAASSGTGFFVSTSGHIVTNYHVIEACNNIKAHYKGKEVEANVLFTDRTNDLTIIKTNLKPNKVFAVSNDDVSLLEDIIVAGYPLGKQISASIKTFKGSVTSLAGYGDNFSNFQIDASLSSGNSGGPIINQKGNVVGVAVAKWIEEGVEGFNFGVKSSTLKTFASSNQFMFQDPSTEELSNKELGQLITEATIYLECWMSVAKIKQIIEEGERQKAFFSEYK